jgi:hypothetical protein
MNIDLRRRPPSERDANVFRMVVVDGTPTREAARAAGVSQTRVRQIVARVVRWLAETLPAEAKEIAPEQALLLAQHTAAARLERFYGDAMHGWRQTQQIKFASLAVRVATALAKLPASGAMLDGVLAGPEEEAGAGGQEPGARDQEPGASDQGRMTNDQAPMTNGKGPMTNDSPPVEDCSLEAEFGAVLDKLAMTPVAASGGIETTSDQLTPQQQAARRALLNAAQPMLTAAASQPVQELRVSPTRVDLCSAVPRRPLSRRERRRLKRAR